MNGDINDSSKKDDNSNNMRYKLCKKVSSDQIMNIFMQLL